MRHSILAFAVLFSLAAAESIPAALDPDNQVVVYTSVDEIVASDVFRTIEAKEGITVLPVYDTESTKTTGLYLRILQEADRPRADVFWNSEFSRTILLKREGLLDRHESSAIRSIPPRFRDPEGYWTGFTVRARVLAFNTDIVKPEDVPRSATELVSPEWKGRVAWANPMFGTTATHLGAILACYGDDVFRGFVSDWIAAFHRAPGNSQVANLVARGTFPLGLTDTDDVWRLKLKGEPIDAIVFDPRGKGAAFFIPNTVSVIRGAPHPQAARTFVDALLAPEIERFLAFSASRQIPVRKEVQTPDDLETWRDLPSIEVGYDRVADSMDRATRLAREIMTRRVEQPR